MKYKPTILIMLTILFLATLARTIRPASAITWSPNENRLTTYAYSDNMPTITETSDQRIWVIWQRSVLLGMSIYYKVSSDQGVTWSAESNLTNVPVMYSDTGPCMIQLNNDNLFLVWSSDRIGNYELFYKTSADFGTTWSSTLRLTYNLANDLRPSIVELNNGTLFLAWSSDRNGNNDLFYKTYNGTSWSPDIPLTSDLADEIGTSAIQTKDGKIWVAWSSMKTGDHEIFYKVYNGTGWSQETNLSQIANREDSSPSIVQTHDQAMYVFWSSDPPTPTGTSDVYYKYSTNNGTTWSPVVEFTTDPYEDLWSSAIQAKNHRVWVVWTSNRAEQGNGNWDVWYRTSLIHNLAVTEVTSHPSVVFRGENISINVAIQNQGDYSEIFTLTCHANSTVIHTHVINLNSRAVTSIGFEWNTSSFTSGEYIINATTSIVTGETYTEDNSRIDGPLRVRLIGDVDNDGRVDADDLIVLKAAYGSGLGDANWNPDADMDLDSRIDASDLAILGQNWNKTG